MRLEILISFLLLNSYLVSCYFQTSFFKEVNKEYINKNVLVSPLSAYQVLGLTTNGAKGETQKQMLKALESSNVDEVNKVNINIVETIHDFSTIEIANAIMSKFKPKQSFLDIAAKYEATVEQLKSLEQVNNWCNLKTHGKIPTILDELDPDVVMILLNAIYFKGTWKTEFDVKNTTKKTFYNFNKEPKSVDTMRVFEKYNYYEDKDAQIIELPYKADSMSAVIILPNENTDINDYISELDDDKLQKSLKRMSPQFVNLELPKFEIEFSALLNTILQNMGMVLPFKGNADFTGIVDGSLYISKVVQKSYLSVDEHGTEATSASAVVMPKSIPPTMAIDRPFIFMLKNSKFPQNYEMLFMTKIEEL